MFPDQLFCEALMRFFFFFFMPPLYTDWVSHKVNPILMPTTWRKGQILQARNTSPRLSSFEMSITGHLFSCLTDYRSAVPRPLSIINLLHWAWNSKNQFTYQISSLLQRALKDMNQQPGKEIHKVRSGSSYPCEVWGASPWHMMCSGSPTQKLSTYLFGVLWRLHYMVIID